MGSWALTAVLGCVPEKVVGADLSDPTVLLVSLDGFRADYPEAADTPALDRLRVEGFKAHSLIPVFPTKTFPNHWTQVTGLYPSHHGIVDNTVYDPETGDWFSMGDSESTQDPRWWGGEPVWQTAEDQGLNAATMFWPGSDARPPSRHVPYDGSLGDERRVEIVLDWLKLPEDTRPQFVTLYFSEPDGKGHAEGPGGPELLREITDVDALVGRLLDGLDERGLAESVDLLVVSDHGMTDVDPARVTFLDEHVPLEDLFVVTWTPVTNLWVEDVEATLAALQDLEHATCAAPEDLEPAWAFVDHPSIGDVVCVAEEGWVISSREWFEDNSDRYTGGAHGYAPELASMQGILYGRGPHLSTAGELEPVRALDLYELMCAVLELEPAPNDGLLPEHLLR
jgi:predicted AlkP superfamily pyrophosphatase or phosphodiesterase